MSSSRVTSGIDRLLTLIEEGKCLTRITSLANVLFTFACRHHQHDIIIRILQFPNCSFQVDHVVNPGSGLTFLMLYLEYPEIIKLMLPHSQFLDARDTERRTVLHHAYWGGERKTVKLLLQAGASNLVKDEDYKVPSDYANEGACTFEEGSDSTEKKNLPFVQDGGSDSTEKKNLPFVQDGGYDSTEKKRECALFNHPKDILEYILSFVDGKATLCFSRTCKGLEQLVQGPIVWGPNKFLNFTSRNESLCKPQEGLMSKLNPQAVCVFTWSGFQDLPMLIGIPRVCIHGDLRVEALSVFTFAEGIFLDKCFSTGCDIVGFHAKEISLDAELWIDPRDAFPFMGSIDGLSRISDCSDLESLQLSYIDNSLKITDCPNLQYIKITVCSNIDIDFGEFKNLQEVSLIDIDISSLKGLMHVPCLRLDTCRGVTIDFIRNFPGELKGEQQFDVACADRDFKMIKDLCASGMDCDSYSFYRFTPLALAVRDRDHDVVESLLELKRPDDHWAVDVNYNDNRTLLQLAIGDIPILCLLLDNEAPIDLRDLGPEMRTALIYAVIRDDIKSARILVERGANRYLKDKRGNIAWTYATSSEMKDVLSDSSNDGSRKKSRKKKKKRKNKSDNKDIDRSGWWRK
jgi:ankyrin repeat protein